LLVARIARSRSLAASDVQTDLLSENELAWLADRAAGRSHPALELA